MYTRWVRLDRAFHRLSTVSSETRHETYRRVIGRWTPRPTACVCSSSRRSTSSITTDDRYLLLNKHGTRRRDPRPIPRSCLNAITTAMDTNIVPDRVKTITGTSIRLNSTGTKSRAVPNPCRCRNDFPRCCSIFKGGTVSTGTLTQLFVVFVNETRRVIKISSL